VSCTQVNFRPVVSSSNDSAVVSVCVSACVCVCVLKARFVAVPRGVAVHRGI